jgi:hypothetical protein
MAKNFIILIGFAFIFSAFVHEVSCKRYYGAGAEYPIAPSQVGGLNKYRWRYTLDGTTANRIGRSRRSWPLFTDEYNGMNELFDQKKK